MLDTTESDSDLAESSSEDNDSDDEDGPSAKKSKLSSDVKKPKKKVKQFPEKVVKSWIWEQDELPNPYEMPEFESQMLEAMDINEHFLENGMNDWECAYEDSYCYQAVKIGGYFPWIQGHNGKVVYKN